MPGRPYRALCSQLLQQCPAIFVGNPADIQRKVHKTTGWHIELVCRSNPGANAFVGPIGFQIGPRNSLRGPQYFNLDTGLSKRFTVVPDWGLKVQLRGDAFNILNHPNFAAPGNNSFTMTSHSLATLDS